MDGLFRWARIATGAIVASALGLLMAFPAGLPADAFRFTPDQREALACVLIAAAIATAMAIRARRIDSRRKTLAVDPSGSSTPGAPAKRDPTSRRHPKSRYERLERTRHMPVIPPAGPLGLADDKRVG